MSNVKSNTLCMLTIILIVGSILLPNFSCIKTTSMDPPEDKLDQMQTHCDSHYFPLGGQKFAQSFIPTLGELSCIELLVGESSWNIGNGSLTVTIRKNYVDGEDLTSIIIPDEEIPFISSWVICDFKDISVIPGDLYYIIFDGGTGITWGWGRGDLYPNGDSWSSFAGWRIFTANGFEGDWCFKTYGRNTAPSVPTIRGVINGKVGERYDYTFVSNDLEGDRISYYIDWGDGEIDEWNGIVDSGQPLIMRHGFDTEGEFIIKAKAKDENGLESDWSEPLHVIMPKNKVIKYPFSQFLDNHPQLFSFLKKVFNLNDNKFQLIQSPVGTIAEIDYFWSYFNIGPFELGENAYVAFLSVQNVGDETGVIYAKLYQYPGTPNEKEIWTKTSEAPISPENYTISTIFILIEQNLPSFPLSLGVKTWGEDETEPQWGTYGKTHEWEVDICGIEPTIEITFPESEGIYTGEIIIEGTAEDLNGDIEKVEIRIAQLAEYPHIAQGTTSWSYTFDTRDLEDGCWTIIATCYDDEGLTYWDLVNFWTNNNFYAPSVQIWSPKNREIVKGEIIISGESNDLDGVVTLNEVLLKIDNNEWKPVSGYIGPYSYLWNYEWNTSNISDGIHTIYAKSYDGKYYSETVEVEVMVDNVPDADLVCTANLNWNDIVPGSMIEGEIIVENNGDFDSLLDWEIIEYPNWGTWNFNPQQGQNLTPEDGTKIIEVILTAPLDENKIFDGEIKIVNKNNQEDLEIISVSLATPKNKSSVIMGNSIIAKSDFTDSPNKDSSNYPPEPEISIDGDEIDSGIYHGRVTVNIQVSTSDWWSCGYDIYYILDGIESAVSGCTCTFIVSTEGYHSIICWAKDSYGTESDRTSAYFTIVFEPVNPYIYGPTNGKVGTRQEFSARPRKPDNAPFHYLFDWGDGNDSGWIGPYNPGQLATSSYTWNEMGVYVVRVKIKDCYNLESGWEGLSVSVPKNELSSIFFQHFFEKHLRLYHIFRDNFLVNGE